MKFFKYVFTMYSLIWGLFAIAIGGSILFAVYDYFHFGYVTALPQYCFYGFSISVLIITCTVELIKNRKANPKPWND